MDIRLEDGDGDRDIMALTRHITAEVFFDFMATKDKEDVTVSEASFAAILAPYNLEYSLFYATVLSRYPVRREETIKECERALNVTDPIAPPTPECNAASHEDRIAYYGQKLRSLKDILVSQVQKKNQIEKEILARLYLKLLSDSERIGMLKVDFDKFMEYCSLCNDQRMKAVSKAIRFHETNSAWKFLACPSCHRTFGYGGSHMGHVMDEHVGELSEKLNKVIPRIVSTTWAKKLVQSSWDPIDVDAAVNHREGWPTSNDGERLDLLRRIRNRFRILVEGCFLAVSQLDHVLQYAMQQVKANPKTSMLLENGVIDEQSTLCIRVLDAPQLTEVLVFLESLLRVMESEERYKDQYSTLGHEHLDDPFCLADESHFLDVTSSEIKLEPQKFSSEKSLLYWLYQGLSWDDYFSAWYENRRSKAIQSKKILRFLQEKSENLHGLCAEKYKLNMYRNALEKAEDLCFAEYKGRYNARYQAQSLQTILRNEKKKTGETKPDREIADEIEASGSLISDVLAEVKKSEKWDDGKNEISIKKAFQKIRETKTERIAQIDANILAILGNLIRVRMRLSNACSHNYLMVLVPLLKSYFKSFIEEEAEKYFAAQFFSVM